mgnify:CR=1 FL=1
MSTHSIEIIEIGKIVPHPNPEVERMELTFIWGWQCCIGINQFKTGDKAIYVSPDFLVPLGHPSFSFLRKKENEGKTQERIKVCRLKGAISQGLIINVPDNLNHLPVGTNVINELGIERYEPPLPKSTGGDFVGGPSGLYTPVFDVKNWQKYNTVFQENEHVYVTEKMHGSSSRFTFAVKKPTKPNFLRKILIFFRNLFSRPRNEKREFVQFCGSRINWMKKDDENIWWMAFKQCPAIGEWCKNNPEKILYGEVFGQVQSLKYGAKVNDIFFAAFGILDKNKWLDFEDAQALAKEYNVPWVPLIYSGPWNAEKVIPMAEGQSTWPKANNIREGVVVLPKKERYDEKIGRVQLKIVSNEYLEKH